VLNSKRGYLIGTDTARSTWMKRYEMIQNLNSNVISRNTNMKLDKIPFKQMSRHGATNKIRLKAAEMSTLKP
jgi:hypothetical protein